MKLRKLLVGLTLCALFVGMIVVGCTARYNPRTGDWTLEPQGPPKPGEVDIDLEPGAISGWTPDNGDELVGVSQNGRFQFWDTDGDGKADIMLDTQTGKAYRIRSISGELTQVETAYVVTAHASLTHSSSFAGPDGGTPRGGGDCGTQIFFIDGKRYVVELPCYDVPPIEFDTAEEFMEHWGIDGDIGEGDLISALPIEFAVDTDTEEAEFVFAWRTDFRPAPDPAAFNLDGAYRMVEPATQGNPWGLKIGVSGHWVDVFRYAVWMGWYDGWFLDEATGDIWGVELDRDTAEARIYLDDELLRTIDIRYEHD